MEDSFKGSTANFIIYFIALFFFYYKSASIVDKVERRGRIVSSILAFIYALIEVVGFTYNSYYESVFEFNYVLKLFIRFIGFYLISSRIIKMAFYAIKNKIFLKNHDEEYKLVTKNIFINKLFEAYKNSRAFRFIFISLIIFICYLPYYLYYFPGSACFDGQWQMAYVDGLLDFSNHHPVFHTMFIAFFMKLAELLGGGNNMAVALYCFFQMCANAMVFSYMMEFLRKLNLKRSIRIIILLCLIFVPTFPLYSITLWKDTGFGLAFVVFTMHLVRIIVEKNEYFNRKNIIFFILSIISVALLRNNGIYVIVLSCPFIIYGFRNHLKYLLVAFGISFAFCFCWNFYIFEIMMVKPSHAKEMLSIPIQAMGRVYVNDELSKEEKDTINTFLPNIKIKRRYNPIQADPLKDSVDRNYLEENKLELISFYFKLLSKYPKTVIDSFIDGCYGYFYPDIDYWRACGGLDNVTNKDEDFHFYDKLGLEEIRLLDLDIIEKQYEIANYWDKISFFNIFLSIGLWFEVLLFLIAYNIYAKNIKCLLVFVPMLFLWLTCLASPVFGEFRYIYALFTCMPIYIAFSFNQDIGFRKDSKVNVVKTAVHLYKNNKNKLYVILFAFLALHLVFYIFIGCKAFINSDSTFIVDYSLEQIETGKFFPPNWVHGNDFWVYSLIPLITIFIKMGIGLFTSRQIAALVQSILLIMLLFDLFYKEMKDRTGGKIAILLILSGVSGLFAFEIFGDATYGTIVFFMLLEVLLFIKIQKETSHEGILLTVFGIILTLITACSLRFPIYIGAPLICYVLYDLYKNKEKKKTIIIGGVIISALVLGVIGHLVLENTFLFKTLYESKGILDSESKLTSNASSAIYNYLTLCGSTYLNTQGLTIQGFNEEITPSSPFVVLTFFRFIFALITFALPFVLYKNFKKMSMQERVIYIYTCSLIFIISFFLLVANMSNWHRYITPVLFFMILLYPIAYKYLIKEDATKRIIFKCYLLLCIITSVFFVSTSMFDFKFLRGKNIPAETEFVVETDTDDEDVPFVQLRVNPYEEIANYLMSGDYVFGYSQYGLEHNLYKTLSEGKLRVVSLNYIGFGAREWLTSLDWFEKDYYEGKTFFIKKKSNKAFGFESLSKDSVVIGDYKILFFDSNSKLIDKFQQLKDAEIKKQLKNKS